MIAMGTMSSIEVCQSSAIPESIEPARNRRMADDATSMLFGDCTYNILRASKDLWRLAIACTVWGDLYIERRIGKLTRAACPRVSTASGSERGSINRLIDRASLATARGTDSAQVNFSMQRSITK